MKNKNFAKVIVGNSTEIFRFHNLKIVNFRDYFLRQIKN